MPSKMVERRIAKLEEQAEERQARGAEDREWLLAQIRAIKARRHAHMTEAEREAEREARRERRAALVARSPEDLARLVEDAAEAAERARTTGDPDDTRRAMLARLRLIQARPAPDTER